MATMRRVVMAGLCGVMLVGCSDPNGRAPTGPASARSDGGGVSDVVEQAKGNGRFVALPVGGAPVEIRFGFHAKRYADGSYGGEFYQQRKDVDLNVFADVTCVSFDPVTNRAWVGGVIRELYSSNPDVLNEPLFQPGRDVWFRVVDYGKHGVPQPDRSTTLGFEGSAGIATSALYCALQPWPDADARTWAVTKGDIKVK